jgi:hypothetical protein
LSREIEDYVRSLGLDAYTVGGAVRDELAGRDSKDADFLVPGVDIAGLRAALAAYGRTEELNVAGRAVGVRFFPAGRGLRRKVPAGIELAPPRREVSTGPGRHDFEIVVDPDATVEEDLSRRDFTINAMAAALGDGPDLIDPHGGREDLESGLIRLLHRGSLRDDPTRALRAARYAARLGFEPEAETAALIRGADLDTVSADRRRAELNRIAAEPEAVRALELLADWGLVEPRPGGLELAARVSELLSTSPWEEFAPVGDAVLAAALGPTGAAEELAALNPARPSEAVEASAGRGPVELALARAMGAEWLDRYLLEWRAVALEIDGEDLITAGVSEGPAVGRGLRAALRLKLDDRLNGRDEELDAALEAARGSDGVA